MYLQNVLIYTINHFRSKLSLRKKSFKIKVYTLITTKTQVGVYILIYRDIIVKMHFFSLTPKMRQVFKWVNNK